LSGRSVRFNDLETQEAGLSNEIDAALRRVVDSCWYILGPEVESFEKEFAESLGAAHAIGTASGTDALSLALLAAGISEGDEVVTSPLTATFSVLAITRIGARPVFADVDEQTLQLSAAAVERKLTPATRAILPVHLYGSGGEIESLTALAEGRGITVVEDACQAHGASRQGKSLGLWGSAGAFSFYPTKNLGALGDGGIVVTDDAALAAKVRRLRNGGQSSRYVHEELGWNSRLDEIQAAVLRAKLPYLGRWNERRRELSARYEAGLRTTKFRPVSVTDPEHSARHLFVVHATSRESLMEQLLDRGVGTLVHYPTPAHLQPAYRYLGHGVGSFPIAEAASESVVSLPLYPSLSDDDVDYVIQMMRELS